VRVSFGIEIVQLERSKEELIEKYFKVADIAKAWEFVSS